MASIDRIVIVGTGLAGGAAARQLRALGFEGDVAVVGAEKHPPYERPPLSKQYLRGETVAADAYVEPEEYWTTHDVELVQGRTAVGIDVSGGRLEFGDGESLPFDRLLLATGAHPRSLDVPGDDLDGVVTLRTLEDADDIRARAERAGRVLVIGGGWIGCEVAASLTAIGCEVTLALPGRMPLEGALGPQVAAVYATMHAEHGVDLRDGTRIVAFDGTGRLRRARAESGEWLDCELAVVAIGVEPRVELAASAGLALGDGVLVDGSLATSDPRIFAAGDVALAPFPILGRGLRVEHWATALAQGNHAAQAMLGAGGSYDEIPYFYSDQYDTGMEFWGDPDRSGEFIVRGEPTTRSFTGFWHEDGRVRAVLNMHVHHGHHHGDTDAGHGHADDAEQPTGGGHDGGHAGGHVDAEIVERLLRLEREVDLDALRDPHIPLASIVEGEDTRQR